MTHTRLLPMLALCAAFSPFAAVAGTLKIVVEGVRSTRGQVLVAVHDRSATFPSDWRAAVSYTTATIRGGAAHALIQGLKSGRYAVVVLHDEDNNKRMTRNAIGFPLEGFGASNNPRLFGPPRYGQSSFAFESNMTVRIRVKYF